VEELETMNPGEKIVNAEVTEDELKVELLDGLHWPDIDEDLSSEGLLRGAPAPRQAVRA
jgi:hypothetical protein